MADFVAYTGVLERGADGGFGVFFPDLPGCVSAGDTKQEASAGAAEALQLHIEGMVEDGTPLPEPTDIDSSEYPLGDTYVAWLYVQAELPDGGPPVRVNITIDPTLLARADQLAVIEGQTRSGLIAAALRDRIDRKFARGNKLEARIQAAEERTEALLRRLEHLAEVAERAVRSPA